YLLYLFPYVLLLLILIVDINPTYALGCFPLQTVAFRGHGFSLLENFTLRGLQTRAVPAGVNGPPLQTTIEIVKESYSTIAKHYVSEGNTRRLQRESEDDETPQRAFFASEEAHREPAESVVYFRSGMSQSIDFASKTVLLERAYIINTCSKGELFRHPL